MYILDVYCKKQTHVDNSLFAVFTSVQSHALVDVYHNAVLHFTLNPLNPELNPICYLLALLGAHHFLHVSRIRVNVHCGPICGGQRVGAEFQLCRFPLTYRTWVCQHFVLDLFFFFLSVLAREHASNEWVKEVVLHFIQRSS